MKPHSVPHVRTTTRTISALKRWVQAYLDYVTKAPLWQLPLHVILLAVLYLVSFIINKFNKEKYINVNTHTKSTH